MNAAIHVTRGPLARCDLPRQPFVVRKMVTPKGTQALDGVVALFNKRGVSTCS
jgi:hypothetical protein